MANKRCVSCGKLIMCEPLDKPLCSDCDNESSFDKKKFKYAPKNFLIQAGHPDNKEFKAKAIIIAHNMENAGNPNTLLVLRLRRKGFTSISIAEIIQIVEDTCPHCYNSDAGCQCTNCN